MWNIVFCFIIIVTADKDVNFFDNCVRNQQIKDPKCQKIRTIDFAIIIDLSISRGSQTESDGPQFEEYYETFLRAFHQRANFQYGLDKVRGAVITSRDNPPYADVRKSFNQYQITDNDLEKPYPVPYRHPLAGISSYTYLDVMLEHLSSMANNEGRNGVPKIVLVLTKGAVERDEIDRIYINLKNMINENFVFYFCGMYNNKFSHKPWKSMKRLFDHQDIEKLSNASSTPILIDKHFAVKKGKKVADCLCDAIYDCQFETVIDRECNFFIDNGVEKCQKKLKPNILKTGTQPCTEERWEECKVEECLANCNKNFWLNATCNCDGKITRMRKNANLSESTKSCPQYEEIGLCSLPPNCKNEKSGLSLLVIIIISAVSFLVFVALVLVTILVICRRKSKLEMRENKSGKTKVQGRRTVSPSPEGREVSPVRKPTRKTQPGRQSSHVTSHKPLRDNVSLISETSRLKQDSDSSTTLDTRTRTRKTIVKKEVVASGRRKHIASTTGILEREL